MPKRTVENIQISPADVDAIDIFKKIIEKDSTYNRRQFSPEERRALNIFNNKIVPLVGFPMVSSTAHELMLRVEETKVVMQTLLGQAEIRPPEQINSI